MKKSILFLVIVVLLTPVQMIAQVGINTDNSSPDPSAMLEVKSADKGFLPPRVALQSANSAAPVTSPAIGLLVWNIAVSGDVPNDVVPGYYYWNGTRWISLRLPAGTNGQTLRSDGYNWIANNVLYNNGTNIGIGTCDPTHKLTIAGGVNTLRLIGPGTFGISSTLNFGDGDYVSLSEDLDDNLLIYALGRTSIMGGNVGIGTVTPDQKLTVEGIIHATSGGIQFPDHTIQTTAALPPNNVHYIGESYGGGIVFFVYDGGQHGLISATADQGSPMPWIGGIVDPFYTMAFADGIGGGEQNTAIIISRVGLEDGWLYAARICNEYASTMSGITYGDWYLPSKYELNLLYEQKDLVGGFTGEDYWSSTEYKFNEAQAWYQAFTNGYQGYYTKWESFSVRAIRRF